MVNNARKPAILVIPKYIPKWIEEEAQALLDTAGYMVVAKLKYKRYGSKLMSRAKLEELAKLASEVREKYYEPKIVIYDDVKPRDYTDIWFKTGLEVIDRTMLILEIFEQHAGSMEAKLQIELALLRHRLPIIRELIRRAKLKELPGFLGPGTYAFDAYYKHTLSRIARIREKLEELKERRKREREARRRHGLPHIAIVGYASAGKTTLFNLLTGETKPTGSEYFTTLSPKTKYIRLSDGLGAVLIDTVGFIVNIPPEIIEAFHATLEEIVESDLILLIVDVSEPTHVIRRKLHEGLDILYRIGAHGKPLIIAANKIDKVIDSNELSQRLKLIQDIAEVNYPGFKGLTPISALKGWGVDRLLWQLTTLLKDMAKSTYYE